MIAAGVTTWGEDFSNQLDEVVEDPTIGVVKLYRY